MTIGRNRGGLGLVRLSLLAAAALGAATLLPRAAAAFTEQVLYSFCALGGCVDGALPFAGLVMDGTGNLYGTTYRGGTAIQGVVFKVAPDGTETVLYTFCQQVGCADGALPQATLIQDGAGNLYGTTSGGGASTNGTVFAVAPDGTEAVLHSFADVSDGVVPVADLIIDMAGNLYGTTGGGGHDHGVVFQVAPDGTETILYAFCPVMGCADGAFPQAGVIMDGAGNLYGTTHNGGVRDAGVVFMLAPDGTETVLYSFCQQLNCTDGALPQAGLIMDAGGNLYGTTILAGTGYVGVVFKVAPDGTETVLHSFTGPDGVFPVAGLVMDGSGNLFGTTRSGGDNNRGVAFELAPDGTYTILYSFCPQPGCADGDSPQGGLIMDAAGNLYGTTTFGGTFSEGVVFKLTP